MTQPTQGSATAADGRGAPSADRHGAISSLSVVFAGAPSISGDLSIAAETPARGRRGGHADAGARAGRPLPSGLSPSAQDSHLVGARLAAVGSRAPAGRAHAACGHRRSGLAPNPEGCSVFGFYLTNGSTVTSSESVTRSISVSQWGRPPAAGRGRAARRRGRPRGTRPRRPTTRGGCRRAPAPTAPHTPRDSMPNARPPRSLARRIASARPGASRSTTACVPSGVRSRGPKPVPPVVTTRPAKPRSGRGGRRRPRRRRRR